VKRTHFVVLLLVYVLVVVVGMELAEAVHLLVPVPLFPAGCLMILQI
jgi:hypothetical protein